MNNVTVGFNTRVIAHKSFFANATKTLSKDASRNLKSVKTDMEKFVGEAIELEMRGSDEWFSLLDDTLRLHFGLEAPGPVLDQLMECIRNEVKVEVKPGNGDILGSMIITLGTDLINKLLLVPGATYESNGFNIPWLRWLLLEGDKIVVPEYQVSLGMFRTSRSGGAIMFPNRKIAGWGVPPEFAGTLQNNWLTRSLDKVLPKIFTRFGLLVRRAS